MLSENSQPARIICTEEDVAKAFHLWYKELEEYKQKGIETGSYEDASPEEQAEYFFSKLTCVVVSRHLS